MNKAARVLLPLLFILLGVGGMAMFMVFKPKPKRASPKTLATRVKVHTVSDTTAPPTVSAQGSLLPSRTVRLQPEVAGKIVWVSDKLKPGGRFAEGEPIFRIDSRNYRLAVKQAEAQVERARFEMKVETGRQKIAQREYKLVGKGDANSEAADLALRRPHLKNAQASLQSAESVLERARLDVERTVVKASFNSMVQQESIEVGQVVAPGAALATMVGTDTFWVQLTVPMSQLALIPFPQDGQPGADVTVIQDLGMGRPVTRSGHVLELLGELDPKGRMARVLVEVEDPLGVGQAPVPLLLGSYVRVELAGQPLRDAYAVPRGALRQGDEVWVMNGKDELEIRTAVVRWRGKEQVYLSSGVRPGDRVVVSRLGAAVTGMKLRAPDTKKKNAAEPRAEAAP